jgi:hypothetical protein
MARMMDALKAKLVERIAAGKVLAVTGTGVSMATTANNPLASWTGLKADGKISRFRSDHFCYCPSVIRRCQG